MTKTKLHPKEDITQRNNGKTVSMKTLFISIFIGLSSFYAFGQTENETEKEAKYRFAKEVFNSKEYKKGNYGRFSEPIDSVDSNTYRFGDKVLTVTNGNRELRQLITTGVFNPDVMFGKETTIKSKAEIDTLSEFQKTLFNLSRNDSLKICCFESLEKLNPNPQTKRFKFWVLRIGVATPTEYYLELYNRKAIKETGWEEFIKNAKMSFFFKGTLIL